MFSSFSFPSPQAFRAWILASFVLVAGLFGVASVAHAQDTIVNGACVSGCAPTGSSPTTVVGGAALTLAPPSDTAPSRRADRVRLPASFSFSGGATHQGAEVAQAAFSGGQGHANGFTSSSFSSNLHIQQALDPNCGQLCGDQRAQQTVNHHQFAAGDSGVTTGPATAGTTSGAVSASSGTAAMNNTTSFLAVQRLPLTRNLPAP